MFCMSKKNLLLVLSVSNWWMQENCKTNTTFQHKQLDYGNWIYQYTLHTARILNTHYACYNVFSWQNVIVVGAKTHYLNPWIWIHESSKGTYNSFLNIFHEAPFKLQILLEEFEFRVEHCFIIGSVGKRQSCLSFSNYFLRFCIKTNSTLNIWLWSQWIISGLKSSLEALAKLSAYNFKRWVIWK